MPASKRDSKDMNANQVMIDMVFHVTTVPVRLTRATLRRLVAYQQRLAALDPEEAEMQADDSFEGGMNIAINALLDHALEDGEREDGMVARMDGKLIPISESSYKPKFKTRRRLARRRLRLVWDALRYGQ